MIDYQVTITSDCDRCGVVMQENHENIFCEKCVDYEITESTIKEILVSLANKFWTDNYKNHIGFSSEDEKKDYVRAFRHGVADTIFWICDELNIVEFFEKDIGHHLENVEYKVDGGLPDVEYDAEYEKKCASEDLEFKARNTPE